MKRTILAGLLIAGALGAVQAEEPKSRFASLKTFFQKLKEGLSESSVSGDFQKRRATAVAAVRGNPQDSADPNKPAFKGGAKGKQAAQLKKERAELSSAVDLVIEGKVQDGIAALESFEKKHPKSALLPDAKEAKAKAQELAAEGSPNDAAAPAAPAAPAKAETKTP